MNILKYIDHFKKRDFLKNISIVISGSVLAQSIGLLLTPAVSRLFTKSDFGIFGSFTSLVSIISSGVTLRYSDAVMLPKKDEDAVNVLCLSVISTLLISSLGIVIAYIFPGWVLGRFESPQSRWLLWCLPLGIFITGLNFSFQGWCIRRKSFKRTASSNIIQTGTSNFLQILTGIFKYGSSGLIVSFVLASGANNLNLGYQIVKDKSLIKKSLNWQKVRELAIEYRDFPIYATPDNVLNGLSQGLPILLLVYFYDAAIAGAYAFGIRILRASMNLVHIALRQVLYQKASEVFNAGGRLLPIYIKLTGGLFVLSFIPGLLLFVFGPQFFSWLFGREWYLAGVYARWIIFWMVPMFCNVPSVLIARILRKQRNLLIFSVITLVLRAGSLIFGGYCLSSLNTIILFSVIGAILNIFLIVCVGLMLVRRDRVNPEDLVDEHR